MGKGAGKYVGRGMTVIQQSAKTKKTGYISNGSCSLFIPSRGKHGWTAPLKPLPQELVDSESDGLARGDTHDTGGDALVEGVDTLLPV